MISRRGKDANEFNRNKSQQYQQIDSQGPKREPDGPSHFDPWHNSVFSLLFASIRGQLLARATSPFMMSR